MPAFRVGGTLVAGLSASANHLSYLPHSGTVLTTMEADLVGYRWSKGALRFSKSAIFGSRWANSQPTRGSALRPLPIRPELVEGPALR